MLQLMPLPAILHNLAELHRTAELGMYRHYSAARRSRRLQRGVSIFQILLNVALGSVFLYAIAEALPSLVKWLGATLALLAAAVGGLESYFGLAKSFERHHKVANDYRALARNAEGVRAQFDDKLMDLSVVASRLSELHQRYDDSPPDELNLLCRSRSRCHFTRPLSLSPT